MTTLGEAVADARARFSAAGFSDAAIEARILIGGLLQLSATEIFVGGDRMLDTAAVARIEDAVARRLKREPVHRILGRREFHGLDFLLSQETLEPRPDTEVLVDSILDHARQASDRKFRILDLGTGTGAILLALLDALPSAIGTASDISADALNTAAENARQLGLDQRFTAVQSHWFDKIDGCFDIIVSNPPYIRSDVIPALDPEVRDFDPVAALDGGPDGLSAYREIANRADGFLQPDGCIGVEIGFDQRQAVTELFEAAGFKLIQAQRDYGDNDRVLIFAKPVFDVAKQKKKLGITNEAR
ncbi:peptide chain release factor N(5)-glutamine methyltransferase [Aliirhizobium smilacinae]|uniref:Release factor glutamine methyltransferase n=1 Tax=Aliirhizobium smilacinae TaxID=1395944 RepID=A0A5C4X837_9HYPH|nr:peptide chain release factor N(5)-glutamine methyltransferase [Rhizobium smilacinae]TNM59665.1 peptide chain release factor N(5)-glutamine methyltransferase [Rhizobium smilacinae]